MFAKQNRKSILISILAVTFVLAFITVTEAQTPTDKTSSDITSNFYSWYLANSGYDVETDVMHNVLLEGTYRDSGYLSTAFIEECDEMVASGEPLEYDMFTCAQDIPSQATVETLQEDENTAAVLVRLYFSQNPRSHNLTVKLIQEDATWKIDNIACTETATARGVVEDFYTQYLDYARDIDGNMRNPLMDGTYKDYPYLSPTFIAEVDTMLTEPPMGMGDPFLCAQDIPTGIYADELYVGDDEARIVVREFFQGNPNPSYSVVNLNESNKQWIIESVQCGLLPSTLVELVFNQYITYARYDVENDIDRNPLTDWPFDWESFLNDDLLATLHTEGFVATDTEGQISFNRLLCAQDFPTRIYANVIDNTQTTTTVQVYGEYPSGQDTFSSMPLSQVVVESLPDGTWQLASIICQP